MIMNQWLASLDGIDGRLERVASIYESMDYWYRRQKCRRASRSRESGSLGPTLTLQIVWMAPAHIGHQITHP